VLAGSDSPKGGIILFGNTHLVEYNTIEDGNNFSISCPGDGFTVRYNTILRAGKGGGIRLTDTPTHTNPSVYFNLLVDCKVGIYAGSTYTGAGIYNNTILNTAVAPQAVLFGGYGIGQVYFKGAMGGAFKDNIVWNTTGVGDSLLFTSVSGSWVSDYNVIGPEAANFISYGGTLYSTLAAYVAGKSQDSHSLKSDPLFVNIASNYALQASSPAKGTGTVVAGINSAPVNMGAF
jgi:hypothetical protein